MSVVTATIEIAAPPKRVWELVMDPACLERWVTIHRRLMRADAGTPREGFTMDQQIHLRGVNMEVHWELAACKETELALWNGRGPARSQAHTEYRLTPIENGTRFDYRNEFRPPLGPLGALVSRALVGGMPLREANHSLERLKRQIEGSS